MLIPSVSISANDTLSWGEIQVFMGKLKDRDAKAIVVYVKKVVELNNENESKKVKSMAMKEFYSIQDSIPTSWTDEGSERTKSIILKEAAAINRKRGLLVGKSMKFFAALAKWNEMVNYYETQAKNIGLISSGEISIEDYVDRAVKNNKNIAVELKNLGHKQISMDLEKYQYRSFGDKVANTIIAKAREDKLINSD